VQPSNKQLSMLPSEGLVLQLLTTAKEGCLCHKHANINARARQGRLRFKAWGPADMQPLQLALKAVGRCKSPTEKKPLSEP